MTFTAVLVWPADEIVTAVLLPTGMPEGTVPFYLVDSGISRNQSGEVGRKVPNANRHSYGIHRVDGSGWRRHGRIETLIDGAQARAINDEVIACMQGCRRGGGDRIKRRASRQASPNGLHDIRTTCRIDLKNARLSTRHCDGRRSGDCAAAAYDHLIL